MKFLISFFLMCAFFSKVAFSAQSSLIFTFSSETLLEDFIYGDEALEKVSDRKALWRGDGYTEMITAHNNEVESICYNGTIVTAKKLVLKLIDNSDCNGDACLARLEDDETVDPSKTYIRINGSIIHLKYTYYGETDYSGEYKISKCK